jgi:chaperonin GroES
VLFDPREAIPVELEHDNRLFVVHLDRVLAIFRRSDGPKASVKDLADDGDKSGE